jgi:hypothetical protein
MKGLKARSILCGAHQNHSTPQIKKPPLKTYWLASCDRGTGTKVFCTLHAACSLVAMLRLLCGRVVPLHRKPDHCQGLRDCQWPSSDILQRSELAP